MGIINPTRLPRKVPYYTKEHKNRTHNRLEIELLKRRTHELGYHVYLIAQDFGLISFVHWELIRRWLTRRIKRDGRISSYLCMNMALTKQASKARMGHGVGELNLWVRPVKPGTILFFLSIQKESLYTKLLIKIPNLFKKLHIKCMLLGFSNQTVFLKTIKDFPVVLKLTTLLTEEDLLKLYKSKKKKRKLQRFLLPTKNIRYKYRVWFLSL